MQLQQEVDRVEAGVGVQENWRRLQRLWRLLQITVWDCDNAEREKGTWVKVCKGNRLINKCDPYYIELSNTYSLPSELLASPIQAKKTH